MSKLHLHIGSYKTGTTSIQKTFFVNKEALNEQGFVYPGNTQNDHLLYFATKANQENWPRQFKSLNGKRLQEAIAKYFSSLENGFTSNSKQQLISTEYLFIHNSTYIENVISFLSDYFQEIKVYLFIRSPEEYYRSFQQQKIKARSYLTPPDLFKYEFKKVAKAWNEVAELEVIPYQSGINSCEILCEEIGLNFEKLSTPDKNSNTSLSIGQMYLLEKIQHHFYQDYEDRFKNQLGIVSHIDDSFTHKPQIQDWVKIVVYNNHRGDLEWLKEEYGIDFLQDYPRTDELSDFTTFENGKASVRDIYKVPSEETVEKYEAMVIDTLLKKLVQSN
ncbi:hypothetical protein [Fodinibius sp. Rm-B-1B1-1]|uniref:hypothetical protein n=1 Tax=Fodinibius alkaliphilus TaxID=3140241 RepID=UPI00315B383E